MGKRKCNRKDWKRCKNKKLRNSVRSRLIFTSNFKVTYFQGEEYINASGNIVNEKTFKYIDICCKKSCCTQLSFDEQKIKFDEFWSLSEFDLQNYMLFSLMNHKKYFWKYSINIYGQLKIICQKFLLNLLQISKKRIRTLQNKIINGI